MTRGGLGHQIRTLAKHGAVYGLGTALGKLIGFFLIPLYTHYLTPADYGFLQLVYLSLEIVSVIVGLRLASSIFRFYHEASDTAARAEVLSTAMITVLVLGTSVILVMILFASHGASIVLGGTGDTTLLRLALLSLLAQLYIGVVTAYIQVTEKSLLFFVISTSRLLFAVGLNIFFVAVLRRGVWGVILAGLIADATAAAILIPYFVRCNGLRFSWTACKKQLRFGIPLIPGSLASIVTHASDRYFIKAYFSLADTGIYSLGYKMGTSIHSLMYVPFSMIWNARRFAIEKEADAARIYARVATAFMALLTFLGLGISLFAADLIGAIAPGEYARAAEILPLIVLCYVIYALEDHVSTGLWLHKRTGMISAATVLSGGVNLALNFTLIPRFGMYGAVAATLASFIIRIVVLFLFARRFYRIPFEWGRLGGLLFGGIGIFLLGQELSDLNSFLATGIRIALWIGYPCAFVLLFVHGTERQQVAGIMKDSIKWLLRIVGRGQPQTGGPSD